ncbi:MAG: hypothetical protein AAF320_00380 [Myxococcota bacterium]
MLRRNAAKSSSWAHYRYTHFIVQGKILEFCHGDIAKSNFSDATVRLPNAPVYIYETVP